MSDTPTREAEWERDPRLAEIRVMFRDDDRDYPRPHLHNASVVRELLTRLDKSEATIEALTDVAEAARRLTEVMEFDERICCRIYERDVLRDAQTALVAALARLGERDADG